jgi:HlyD family secretion protein
VRVDVRLEDVPQVAIGQPVSIETAALAAPLAGQVSWVTTRADIQKNTLQVKVAINNPPATITPEMLAQVTFVAPPQPESAAVADDPLRMLVPRALVVQGESGGAFLWVIHPHRNVAELRPVEIGKATAGDLIEIAAGVDPTAKLIVAGRESLTAGDRVRITGEAPSAIQGVGGPPTAAPASVAQAPSHTN